MWADEANANWLGIWSNLTHCGTCHTLMASAGSCPRCGFACQPHTHSFTDAAGVTQTRMPFITPGAFTVTTATLLALMQREWERPNVDSAGRSFVEEASPKLVLVILFWTLFEHLMDRFFNAAVSQLRPAVGRDLMDRYSFIGARMFTLYPLLFEVSFEEDLTALGFASVYTHLRNVQEKRNEFIHGNASAITDALVRETVERLHDVQRSIVALYNQRCAGSADTPMMWHEPEPRRRRG
jgi:hypothetical protein